MAKSKGYKPAEHRMKTIPSDSEEYQRRLAEASRNGNRWQDLFLSSTPTSALESGNVRDLRPYWQVPALINNKKGICPCCLREIVIKASSLCSACYKAAGCGNLYGEDLIDALLKARRRLQDQGVTSRKPVKDIDTMGHLSDANQYFKTPAELFAGFKSPAEVRNEEAEPEQEASASEPELAAKDPTGRSAHDPGAKLDAGKPRLGLVFHGFARALWEVGRVGTQGAETYSDNGWMQVPDGIERYTNAAYRHRLQEAMDEAYDQQSGFLHAAHDAWNALARLEIILREQEKGEE